MRPPNMTTLTCDECRRRDAFECEAHAEKQGWVRESFGHWRCPNHEPDEAPRWASDARGMGLAFAGGTLIGCGLYLVRSGLEEMGVNISEMLKKALLNYASAKGPSDS